MDSVRRIGMYRESPGSDIVKQGHLKKLKVHVDRSASQRLIKEKFVARTMKKKFFVLRATSSSGPARLDYFDNEKKFKAGHPPKKSYHLHTVFNINKKIDPKHKFGICVFLPTECFSVLAESQEEQEDWISKMLEYENEYLPQDTEPRTHYEHVWHGIIKHKSPTSCTRITGPYRLCLSDKAVSLVKPSEYKPSYQFQFSSIRKCGAQEHFFLMEVGRSAVTGSGEIWLEVESSHAAQSMHDIVLSEMAASRAAEDPFRRRSNTSSSAISHSGETFKRKRATSESHHHHSQGSPRRNRAIYAQQRPQSTVVYSSHTQPRSSQLAVDNQIPLGSSPSAFDPSFMDEARIRSDSMGSRSSRCSRHSDMVDHPYENTNPNTPVISPDGSFISARSLTPEASYSITEEDLSENEPSDYLSMTPGHRSPGHRSMTPSPTRGHSQAERGGGYLSMTPGQSEKTGGDYLSMTPGQGEKSSDYLPMTPGQSERSDDYLPMTPGQRSETPSPTRFSDRLGSIGSNPQSSSVGYMDMRPGSASSGAGGGQEMYMNMTPPKASGMSYMDMTPTTPPVPNNGYVDMNPGQRTPTDPGPGYVLMDGVHVRSTAPIPIRANKEPGYMDMGPSSQPLPTVKESGSGEAYLPMSPTGQSNLSSEGLKPAKVISYLSDDSMSGEFPKRAYSVGSRPISKPSLRYRQPQEVLRHEPLDSSKSSSAPHLIVQKSRIIDALHRNQYEGHYCASPLSQSVKSDDSDSFAEMDFYRPRTASDSYGCRPRSSSFGKQLLHQGHRPRSSSYGQGGKGTMSKLAAGFRQDSFESVRTTSQELSSRQRSQESLGILSSSSRNSSSESLKKLSEGSQSKKNLQIGEYMDMNYDKRKTPSPGVHGVVSPPKKDSSGYMDMSVGSPAPKPLTRGISPCSSTHSLPNASSQILGSSPASGGHGHTERVQGAKVIKPSGKVASQKSTSKGIAPAHASSDNHLKVVTTRLKKGDKRSPSSSGKESEDESYVPFQPGALSPASQDELASKSHTSTVFDFTPKSHPGLKIQHGYSRSHDSGVRSPESGMLKPDFKPEKSTKGKKDSKSKTKTSEDKSKSKSERKVSEKNSPKSEREKTKTTEENILQAAQGQSPTLERNVAFMPDDDIFSNKIFNKTNEPQAVNKTGSAERDKPAKKTDDSGYMDYLPGFEESLDKNKSKETEKPPLPKHLVEREYCEIDFPDKTESSEKSKDEKAMSDYMEADPAPLKVGKKGSFTYESSPSKEKRKGSVGFTEPGSDKNKRKGSSSQSEMKRNDSKKSLSDDFSYMDFDPGTDKKVEQEKEETVKSPQRVLSFLAHSTSEEEKVADEGADVGVGSKRVKNERNERKVTGFVEDTVSVNQTSDYIESCIDNTSNKSTGQKCQNSASLKFEGEKDVKGDSGKDAKSVIDGNKDNENKGKDLRLSENGSVENRKHGGRLPSKLIIKQVSPAYLENESIQDAGYCDLDFSGERDIVSARGQKRSESTSSSNSDRSRKIIDSVGSEDSIPCPETPISYISEEGDDIPIPETPLSYISDDSTSGSSVGSREFGSPFKSPMAGRSNQSLVKTAGFGLSSFGASGENLRKSLPASRSHGGMQQNAALSRQSSVPVGPPAISPRSSTDMQHAYRTRKASGPACLSSQGRSGNGTITNNLKQASPGCLEPTSTELHKQKSMPCMTVPQNLDKIQDVETIEHVQSRHSFSDLSQCDDLNLPGIALSKGNQIKSSSQQQLASDTGSNEMHYAELELRGSNENMDGTSPRVVKSRHPSSLDDVSKEHVQYVEIDHIKTEKMKNLGDKDVKFYVS